MGVVGAGRPGVVGAGVVGMVAGRLVHSCLVSVWIRISTAGSGPAANLAGHIRPVTHRRCRPGWPWPRSAGEMEDRVTVELVPVLDNRSVVNPPAGP